MKVLILEDEPLGAEALCSLLRKTDESIEVVGVIDSVSSAIRWLSSNKAPDLIFMDIELADGQCFEVFKEVEISSLVIFTTSYNEYALKAFQFNSIDYLLKPVSAKELKRSLAKLHGLAHHIINKVIEKNNLEKLIQHINEPRSTSLNRERFLVKQGQRFISLETTEIAYFFSKGKVTFLKRRDGKEYIIDYSLDQLQQMLSPQTYFRLNRQVIAAHSSVVKVQTGLNGKLKVQLSPPIEDELIVSRERAREFRHWLGE